MKNYSLKTKLVVGASAMAIGGMLVVGSISYVLASHMVSELIHEDLISRIKSVEPMIKVAQEENQQRAIVASGRVSDELLPIMSVDENKRITMEIENEETHEKKTVSVPTLLLHGRPVSGSDVIDNLGFKTGGALTVFVTIPEGLVRYSTTLTKPDGTRAVGTYIPNSSPIFKSLMEGVPHFGRGIVLGQPFMTTYLPYVQGDKIAGAVFAGAPDSTGDRVRDYLRGKKLFDTGYYYIMDSTGTMALHPAKEGQNLLASTDVDGRPIFKEIIEKKNGMLEYRWLNAETNQVQDKLAYFQYYPELDWYVAASMNQAEAFHEVIRLRWLLIAGMSVSILLIAGFAVFVAAKFSKLLSGMAERVKSNSDMIASQSGRVLDMSKKLASSSTSQAAAIQETASALEEVSATVQKNLSSTQQAQEISNESKEASELGREVMERLSSSVMEVKTSNDGVRDEMSKSYDQIRAISDVMKSIEEKTRVIHDIVFQTKLLSFNASVEAARAGEHGKGFAVVAEEIAQLASMAGVAAREVDTTLAQSVAQVGEIITGSEQRITQSFAHAHDKIETSVAIAGEGKQSLERVLENATRLHHVIEEITVASREQATAIGEITKAIAQIDQATHENADQAQESTALSTELSSEAETLEQATSELELLVYGDSASGEREAA